MPSLAPYVFVHGNGLKLIHHSRPHPHQAMSVQHQLSYIAILRRGHPDPRKVIFQHQLQYVLGIKAIVPLLAHSLGSNLRWIPHPTTRS